MNKNKMPTLNIGNKTCSLPIIQGGMGVGLSLSKLAAAVANEGGIGVISATGLFLIETKESNQFLELSCKILTNEIKKAKSDSAGSSGLIGVNILIALTKFEKLLLAAYEAGADLFFLGAGLPLKFSDTIPKDILPKILKHTIPIVSSARAANLICKTWKKKYNMVPNAFVVEGPLAGGHLGFKKTDLNKPENQLEKILPGIFAVTKKYEDEFNKKISIVAAGGIFTGEDIRKFFDIGVQGVQMGTRFIGTFECEATDEFKKAYLKCTQKDIIIIDSPVGLPGRAINNQFLIDVHSGINKPFNCPFKCLKTCDYKKAPYCIAISLYHARNGKLDNGFAFCGSNAYRINKIVSVKELINELLMQ